MNYILNFISDFFNILNEMSPYLLLGFLFAGILHVAFPRDKINKYMGKKNLRSVIAATLLGIPLPLCSCGVIPTGISFYKSGASKGASISFLISTPQTGIDSILVSYSLLGLPFAIIRIFIALITGVVGGVFTNSIIKNEADSSVQNSIINESETGNKKNKFIEMLRYAFVEFLQDISKWLIIGLLLASVISVLIPNDFFINFVGNDFLSMLIVLIAAIPLYVCATGSVPIAAMLMIKGLSPGAALVFLMAGPATNAATITVINNVMGKKTLYAYLFSIISGALIFGTLINTFLPSEWFMIQGLNNEAIVHNHEILPQWFKIASSIVLLGLIINAYIVKYYSIKKSKKVLLNQKLNSMNTKTVIVKGMTCNHCKMNVEKNLNLLDGIKNVNVDLLNQKVIIEGDNIDINVIKQKVESIGYEFVEESKNI